jgi:Ca2+-binding RTX toxin-like protein
MRPDGSDDSAVNANDADNFDPAWSPDGDRIAFANSGTGSYDLYTINADGTGMKRLTTKASTDEYPDWRPGCSIGKAKPLNCGIDVANNVSAGAGDDVVFTGPGNDVVIGGNGNDVMVGGSGGDVLQGQKGNDRIAAGPGPGADRLSGGAGRDYLDARDGKGGDTLRGGPEPDTCRADRKDETSTC